MFDVLCPSYIYMAMLLVIHDDSGACSVCTHAYHMVWYDCVGKGVLRDDGLGSSSHPLHEQERRPAEVHSCGHRSGAGRGNWGRNILHHQIDEVNVVAELRGAYSSLSLI